MAFFYNWGKPMPFEKHYRLKGPCENCPFLKDGAIPLAPGRLEGIVEGLLTDDHSTFPCHKTTTAKSTGGTWTDEGEYKASGREAMCAGAMIYLEKAGRPTVGMRIGRVLRKYDPARLQEHYDKIVEPDESSNGRLPAPKNLTSR